MGTEEWIQAEEVSVCACVCVRERKIKREKRVSRLYVKVK